MSTLWNTSLLLPVATKKSTDQLTDQLTSGDRGYLNIHLKDEERKKGVGYLGRPLDTVYEVLAIVLTPETGSEPEIRVMELRADASNSRSYIIPAKYFNKWNDVSEPLTRDNADEHCNDQRHTEYWSEDHTWIPAEKFDIIEYTNPNPVKGWWCPNEEISEQELSVLKLKVDSDETRAFFIAREEKKKDDADAYRLYKKNRGWDDLDDDECEFYENRDDEDPDCEYYSNHPWYEWHGEDACGEGKFIRVSKKKRKLNSNEGKSVKKRKEEEAPQYYSPDDPNFDPELYLTGEYPPGITGGIGMRIPCIKAPKGYKNKKGMKQLTRWW